MPITKGSCAVAAGEFATSTAAEGSGGVPPVAGQIMWSAQGGRGVSAAADGPNRFQTG